MKTNHVMLLKTPHHIQHRYSIVTASLQQHRYSIATASHRTPHVGRTIAPPRQRRPHCLLQHRHRLLAHQLLQHAVRAPPPRRAAHGRLQQRVVEVKDDLEAHPMLCPGHRALVHRAPQKPVSLAAVPLRDEVPAAARGNLIGLICGWKEKHTADIRFAKTYLCGVVSCAFSHVLLGAHLCRVVSFVCS